MHHIHEECAVLPVREERVLRIGVTVFFANWNYGYHSPVLRAQFLPLRYGDSTLDELNVGQAIWIPEDAHGHADGFTKRIVRAILRTASEVRIYYGECYFVTLSKNSFAEAEKVFIVHDEMKLIELIIALGRISVHPSLE